ncbi:DUF998 domain-containing protein [Agromyces aureus]|uniref:DUF998 domain-containing protein n=1 Tax=Agromyces aureus TaxID=453304 RepID=A0A191WIA4_9MICO|nr:DUF998 domain-containing protein [Agromyces aureus]ANJ27947.1 hypothetical protein ATC03_15725 [Agromyces aureus]
MTQSTSLARIVRRPIDDAEARESTALLVGAAAFLVGTVPALFLFQGRDLPIAGRDSFGDAAAIGAALAALAAFLFGCVLRRAQQRALDGSNGTGTGTGRRLRWFDVAALALSHAVIALLGWVGLAAVFAAGFEGAVLYSVTAAILVGVVMAITAYAAFLSAVSITPMLLSIVLAVFLVVGTLASTLSASDPLWWQKNLSTLGISDDISSLTFNLTLIIAGVMVTTVAHYATAWLPTRTRAEQRGQGIVRLALIVMGVMLACVGIFPVDEFLEIHNLSATGMAIVYVILVIALRSLVPTMPRVFLMLGYLFVAVIVVIAVFFITGYYNLTAVELIAFSLVFAWLIVFLRTAGSMAPTDAASTADAAGASVPIDRAEPESVES